MFQFDSGMMIERSPGKYRINLNNEAGAPRLASIRQHPHRQDRCVESPADAEAFEREQTAMFIRELGDRRHRLQGT